MTAEAKEMQTKENLQELYGWVENSALMNRYSIEFDLITTKSNSNTAGLTTRTSLNFYPYSAEFSMYSKVEDTNTKDKVSNTEDQSTGMLSIKDDFLTLAKERQAIILAYALKVANRSSILLHFSFDPDQFKLLKADVKTKVSDFILGKEGNFYSQVLEEMKRELETD